MCGRIIKAKRLNIGDIINKSRTQQQYNDERFINECLQKVSRSS